MKPHAAIQYGGLEPGLWKADGAQHPGHTAQ